MQSLCRLILIYSVFTALPTASSKNKEIDWASEVVQYYSHFDVDYDAVKMDRLVRDTFVDDFVRITSNTIIQGDWEDLAQHFTAHHKHGQWEQGPPRIVSICGNTAVVWSELFFTDDDNSRRKIYVSVLLEYTDNRAKAKLLQLTV